VPIASIATGNCASNSTHVLQRDQFHDDSGSPPRTRLPAAARVAAWVCLSARFACRSMCQPNAGCGSAQAKRASRCRRVRGHDCQLSACRLVRGGESGSVCWPAAAASMSVAAETPPSRRRFPPLIPSQQERGMQSTCKFAIRGGEPPLACRGSVGLVRSMDRAVARASRGAQPSSPRGTDTLPGNAHASKIFGGNCQ
jgi:hypothetical protein